MTCGAQNGLNARRAMASTAFRMDTPDIARKGPVIDAAFALGALPSGVSAR
ncbi:hypothetical protein [Rhodovulum sulfidophilum]|uniref:hypothetical protein n=1 Tax=Rhodovulum sulfidophilum TaxID=35806 RepID=UPI001EE3C8A6|nr:hypothetical protein [Rhodovulum sulfidophilum]